ncbi:MAG: hypothetical protein JXQ75_09430, partial [Phycisphaerae bacterium]|nr:hypothetical protein [Phycisphaerae bacterium]
DDEGEDEGEDEAENGEGEDEGEDEVENGEGEDEGEDEDEVDDIDADEKGVGDEKPKGDVVVPHIKKEAEIDPTLSPRRMRTRTERGMYDEAVERAKLFAVPVLRQEQFFNFIGIESAPDSAKRLRR